MKSTDFEDGIFLFMGSGQKVRQDMPRSQAVQALEQCGHSCHDVSDACNNKKYKSKREEDNRQDFLLFGIIDRPARRFIGIIIDYQFLSPGITIS